MDLSFTPRSPVRRRRRLLIAAATAVSSILFVRYGPLNYHYHESEASAPREKSQHIHRLEELPTQLQSQPPQEQQRRLDECYIATNNWHLTMSGKNTCSNDDNFPGGWSNITMPRFFQPTCAKCCEQMFPRLPLSGCSCIDVCSSNTEEEEDEVPCETTNDPCCDRYWHIDLTAKFTCSNTYSTDGTYYPPDWNNNELMVGTTMFKTVEDCCYKITNGDVDKCVMVEAEECKTSGDGDTPSPTPRPTTASPTPRPTTSSPTPRPTLHLTIPPHLLPQPTTPQPTLHITIPPHLLPQPTTPQPTLHITIPPHLLPPPTNPPQDVMVPQSSPVMVPQSAPVQLQNDCKRQRRRRRCQSNTSCEWIRSKRSCRPKIINGIVNNESSTTTTTTTTVAATEPPNTNADAEVCTEGFKWHRGKPSEGSKCTNDFNYPSAWDDPQNTDRYLFDTPEKCCLAHFTLESCTVINACGEAQTLDDASSSSAQNDALVSMSEAIPSTGSSSSSSTNCSNKRRRKCKVDPNCRWRRAPHRKCVAA